MVVKLVVENVGVQLLPMPVGGLVAELRVVKVWGLGIVVKYSQSLPMLPTDKHSLG